MKKGVAQTAAPFFAAVSILYLKNIDKKMVVKLTSKEQERYFKKVLRPLGYVVCTKDEFHKLRALWQKGD